MDVRPVNYTDWILVYVARDDANDVKTATFKTRDARALWIERAFASGRIGDFELVDPDNFTTIAEFPGVCVVCSRAINRNDVICDVAGLTFAHVACA